MLPKSIAEKVRMVKLSTHRDEGKLFWVERKMRGLAVLCCVVYRFKALLHLGTLASLEVGSRRVRSLPFSRFVPQDLCIGELQAGWIWAMGWKGGGVDCRSPIFGVIRCMAG